MNDALLLLTAVSMAGAAFVAPPVPAAVLVLAAALVVTTRHPVAMAALLVLVVAGRSHASLAALDEPLPAMLSGTAALVSDPVSGEFGTSVELRLGGRRWQAQVERGDEWALRPLMTGDRIRVEGRPQELRGAPEGWRRSRHLAGRLRVTRIGPGPRAPPWYRAANEVHRLLAAGSGSFRAGTRALYLGLVVGDDRGQSDLDRFRFDATGLGHLLAVSGQNVAFLLLVVRPLLGRCDIRMRWVLGIAVLVAFVLVTRAEASVLRASAMAAVALVAGSAGRTASGARMLALAVIGLLLLDPLLISGLGFQLSLCATIGLLVGVRPIADRLRGPTVLRETIAATLAAQIATAPLLIRFSGWVPSVATLANVAAVPVAGVVMVLGMTVGLVAGTVVAPVAAMLTAPVELLVGWIGWVAKVGSRTSMPLLGPDRIVLLATAAAVAATTRPWRRWPIAIAVALMIPALAPVSPQSGRTDLARGVAVTVDRCGHRTVELAGRIDVSDALTALALDGVVHADVVVGPRSAASSAIAEQLGARLRRSDDGAGRAGGPCTVRS